jgi:hypothetical protein
VIIFHSLQNHFHPQDKNSINGNNKYRDSKLKENLSCSLAFPLLRITTPEDKKTKRKKTPSSISNHDKIPKKIQSSNQASKQALTHSLTQSINRIINQASNPG